MPTIKLTPDEKIIPSFVMHHYTDYLAGDNRPNHALARLKQGRENMNEEQKKIAYHLAGRLMR